MRKPTSPEDYFLNNENFQDLVNRLRAIVLQHPFEETMKWMFPTYVYQGKNVAALGSFKTYAGIWFFDGALLKDPAEKLMNAQEGKTYAMRQWRMMSLEDLDENLLHEYIIEALDNCKAGRKVFFKKKGAKPVIVPSELQCLIDKDPNLRVQFEGFSLSKKREFTEYVETAKRQETRDQRALKSIELIRKGIGLNDKYR